MLGFSCHGQNLYSLENLQQATPDVVSTYLTFAKKQKKTGSLIIKTGLITVGAGIIVAAASYDNDDWIGINTGTIIGAWMVILGAETTLVGLPIHISGSSRVKRITGIMNNNQLSLELAPCMFQNYLSKNDQTGATLRIRF